MDDMTLKELNPHKMLIHDFVVLEPKWIRTGLQDIMYEWIK